MPPHEKPSSKSSYHIHQEIFPKTVEKEVSIFFFLLQQPEKAKQHENFVAISLALKEDK